MSPFWWGRAVLCPMAQLWTLPSRWAFPSGWCFRSVCSFPQAGVTVSRRCFRGARSRFRVCGVTPTFLLMRPWCLTCWIARSVPACSALRTGRRCSGRCGSAGMPGCVRSWAAGLRCRLRSFVRNAATTWSSTCIRSVAMPSLGAVSASSWTIPTASTTFRFGCRGLPARCRPRIWPRSAPHRGVPLAECHTKASGLLPGAGRWCVRRWNFRRRNFRWRSVSSA